MKIGTSPLHVNLAKPIIPKTGQAQGRSASFDAHLAQAEASDVTQGNSEAGRQSSPDFTNITKAEYVAWGKKEFEKGNITLDDLFHVQCAGGDFDGSASSDTEKHDFVAHFSSLIDNEIKARRGSGPQSMVPAYRHVLASMTRMAAE
jgi:hypothetical protein